MYNVRPRPPPQLNLTGCLNHAEAWREWYSQFTAFLKASGGDRGGADVKAGLLLELIGPKGYSIFSSFMFEKAEDRQDFEKLVNKFDDYFAPKQCSAIARYNFFTRNQAKDESIDDYVIALQSLAAHCRFDHLEEGLIRDRIVCGIWRDDTRKILLETDNLDLNQALEICRGNNMPENEQVEGDTSSSEVAMNRPTRRRCRFRRRLATSIKLTNWSSTC